MFWIISAILIAAAIAFILPSLKNFKPQQDATREQNIFIAQEQMSELEKRFERGDVSSEVYQQSRDELELSLYSDIKDGTNKTAASSAGSKFSMLLILLLIPAITIPVYLKFGNLDYINSLDSKQAIEISRDKKIPKNADGTPDIETMVAGLQQKLEQNPDNAEGWYMLGRSYMVLKHYPKAAKAFTRANNLVPENPDVMLSLADSLSMSNQGQLMGRPAELIKKALTIRPDDLTALWLSGMAERQQGNNIAAIKQWNKVLPLLKAQPQQAVELQNMITQARRDLNPQQLAQLDSKSTKQVAKQPVNQDAQGIRVKVDLSADFKDKASADDLVFIYAKAMSGPPMPLAAVKRKVQDLPVEVTLDDSMAMMPNLTLSSFDKVVVGARVSKTGSPIGNNGDLYSEASNIEKGAEVKILIDSILSK